MLWEQFNTTEIQSRDLGKEPDYRFLEKIKDIVNKFGFRNKEVVIEEEDPSMIQLTTQMSAKMEGPLDYYNICTQVEFESEALEQPKIISSHRNTSGSVLLYGRKGGFEHRRTRSLAESKSCATLKSMKAHHSKTRNFVL